jgi:hypothetical protein
MNKLKVSCIFEYSIFFKLKLKRKPVIECWMLVEASCEYTAKIKIRDEIKEGMAFDYRVECKV